jgi:ribosome-binding protein aMBF1 (putative translation factor)
MPPGSRSTPAARALGKQRTQRVDRLRELWGERIFEERTKLGLTQGELAARIGVTQSEVSRIEWGERQVSDHDRVALAEELGFDDVSDLFDYKADKRDDESAA